MESSIEMYEEIEKYLFGQMTTEEKSVFEKKLSENITLRTVFEAHKTLLTSFGVYKKRKEVKSILDKTHESLQGKVDKSSINVKPRGFIFRKKELGIAASIALVISIGTYLVMNLANSFNSNDKAHYRALSRDLERVKSSQNKIISEIRAEKPAIREASFGGTAVAISEGGYVLTSYHVVKNMDSVYIENKAFSRLKMKTVYKDPVLDLVILKVEDSLFSSFGPLPFMFRKSDLALGEMVYTLGYPKKDIVFGEGYISSIFGYEGDTSAYQISVPVNPGQSGGPLFDQSGNLVGIVSGKHTENESSAFAVKANYLREAIMANDSLSNEIKLTKGNSLKNNTRVQAVKKLQDFVFEVKAYN